MGVDKGGSVVERVQPHEIDHGQHDAVRDVFIAPGGFTLVRADLFDELGGYDPTIVAMGEDLDLCWRAQVVGARIIVAPDARVRHLEQLASGERPLEASLLAAAAVAVAAAGADTAEGGTEAPGAGAQEAAEAPEAPEASEEPGAHEETATAAPAAAEDPGRPVTLQELQRRHELLAVFTCYSRSHLLRVVPQVFLLAVGEVVVAELAGNRNRARAVVRAWRWNLGPTLGHPGPPGGARRPGGDWATRRSVSSRCGGAPGCRPTGAGSSSTDSTGRTRTNWRPPRPSRPKPTAAPAEGLEFEPESATTEAGRVSGQARLLVWLVAALLVVIGSRGVLSGRLPAVGQFTPFPSWSSTFAQFFTGWHPSGVGTTAPAAPGLAIAGVVGTILLGAMGLTQKVLIFGCLPLGAWGAVRLLRPFGSQRAALVAGLAYLADAAGLQRARPRSLGRADRLRGRAVGPGHPRPLHRARAVRAHGRGAAHRRPGRRGGGQARGSVGPGRRATVCSGDALALGVLEAVLISFVPAAAIVVLLVAVAAAAVVAPVRRRSPVHGAATAPRTRLDAGGGR